MEAQQLTVKLIQVANHFDSLKVHLEYRTVLMQKIQNSNPVFVEQHLRDQLKLQNENIAKVKSQLTEIINSIE